MAILNFEFKARASNLFLLENKLLELNPTFIGEDHQIDTYFNVSTGRLKLREGNIENALIYYERENTTDAKQSDILLYQHKPDKALKDILIRVHGIKTIVDKKRKIYFIDNVKFHFDHVQTLGTFIEVEAIDKDGSIGIEKLKQQCSYYAELFGIKPADYEAFSYSDLLLNSIS
ncbi:MAG: class IV adenylate cyclase [Chitinophagaceae bacterium]|nr:class IV adenylate cyclase [Chitinophagaceae bacterium]